MKIIYLNLVGVVISYLVEIEVPARKMQCLTEIFDPNEPISIQMQIFEFKEHSPPLVYLSILNTNKNLLAYQKVSQEESLTKMTFNNGENEEL